MLLNDFLVLFKAGLIFKDFSRKPSKFKYFSSLCNPCLCSLSPYLIMLHVKFDQYCPTDFGEYGPRHEKTCLRRFANNTGTDQPAHQPSLISAFVIHYLESIICKLATGEISIL